MVSGYQSPVTLRHPLTAGNRPALCWRSSVEEQVLCKHQAVGSNPSASPNESNGSFPKEEEGTLEIGEAVEAGLDIVTERVRIAEG